MVYLLLAIACSTGVSLALRFSKTKVGNNYGLLCINYLMCILLSLNGRVDTLMIQGNTSITLLIAGISGILYMASFVALQKNISINGLIYSSLFAKLGLVVTLLISVLFFQEIPTVLSILGILLALAGIFYLNHSKESIHNIRMLIILLAVGGLCDSMSKIFSELGETVNNNAYLFYTFLFALLTSLIFLFKEKQKAGKYEILYGCLVGIPNFFCSKFLLLALNSLKAIIVYPCYSVGSILTIGLSGMLLFHEKIDKRGMIAYLMMIIAIVLLNI